MFLKDFMTDCLEWKNMDESEMEEENISIKEQASTFVEMALSTRPDLATDDQLDQMIKQFVKNGDSSDACTVNFGFFLSILDIDLLITHTCIESHMFGVIANIYQMYTNEPEKQPAIAKHAEAMINCNKADESGRSMIYTICWQISQNYPEVMDRVEIVTAPVQRNKKAAL